MKERRTNSGPKSAPAQARKMLYQHAIPRVKDAIENRYPLEAIALLESMIADRLEARVAALPAKNGVRAARTFSMLAKLATTLRSENSGESGDAKGIYQEVAEWARHRNKALHEMVKLAEGNTEEWGARMNEAQSAATKGLVLFRKVDALVKKLNKPAKK